MYKYKKIKLNIELLAIIVINLLSLQLSAFLFGKNNELTIKGALTYTLPLIIIFFSIRILSVKIGYKNLKNTLKSFFRDGRYLILIMVIFFLINLGSISSDKLDSFQIRNVFFFLLTCFFTGVFEELLFRGIVLTRLSSIYSPRVSVTISSIFFGIVHLLNLIDQPWLIKGTLTQVFYTFCLGMILGTIYSKGNNIFTIILLHASFNFFGSFSQVFTSNISLVKQDSSMIEILIPIILIVPSTILSLKKMH
ncbi:lysostaphin resistance A-like protein [Enterococcus faecalis]